MTSTRYATRYIVAPKGQPWRKCRRYTSPEDARKHMRPGMVLLECQVCYELGHMARIIGVGDAIEEA